MTYVSAITLIDAVVPVHVIHVVAALALRALPALRYVVVNKGSLLPLLSLNPLKGITRITPISFNSNVGGAGYTIDSVKEDPFSITNGSKTATFSICSVDAIYFNADPPLTAQNPIKTLTNTPPTTPGTLDYCRLSSPVLGPAPIFCCNQGIADSIPIATSIDIIGNENGNKTFTVLAVCTDIIWLAVKQGLATFAVIPLCSVVK